LREHFHVVEIGADVPVAPLLFTGVRGAVASRLADQAELADGTCALVQADETGLALAAALRQRGVDVTLVAQPGVTPPPGYEVIEAIPDAVDAAVAGRTHGNGFDVIAAPLQQWAAGFGWLALAEGGGLIDTAHGVPPLIAPPAAFVLRADLPAVTGRRAHFAAALRQAVQRATHGELAAASAASLSIADLVTQKPAIADPDAPLIISFDDTDTSLPVQIDEAVAFRADATYLVTGGFGGFGQKTAHWLVERGARHLVLAGRGGADTPERQAFVQELQAQAVEVVCVKCDLADAAAVRSLFTTLASRAQPLRGVFHTAGVIIDGPIGEMPLSNLEAVMRAKAESARLLDEHTRNLELDYFVLYSSVAALIGNNQQANYVAANSFLDGLVWRRRALGLPATSINWGAIQDVGMIARDQTLRQYMRHTGMRGIESSEGLHWLERVLRRNVPQLGIMLISSWVEWQHYEALGSQSPRYAALIAADTTAADADVHNLLRAELEAIPAAERFAALTGKVVSLIATQLGLAAEGLLADRPILDYGVDSLMAAEIQMLLGTRLGISVPILEILDGRLTIRKIVERTLADFGWGEQTSSSAENVAS
jgi:acyl carrier protein